jgi:hypothetical protein
MDGTEREEFMAAGWQLLHDLEKKAKSQGPSE